MKKSTINFIIDGLMFICMAAITGIGFLIKYTLIPGQQRRIEYGNNVDLYLFGMNRHEWGSIHLIIGFILLGLVVLHIILHWKFITCIYNRIFQKPKAKRLSTIIFITICSLFLIAPFFIKPATADIGYEQKKETTNDFIRTNRRGNYNRSGNRQQHSFTSVDVRGNMTLNEISKKYKVPTNIIKKSLHIPISVSDNQKLNWIRTKYNIKIRDVENIINEYHE